ncbi:MAG: cytochrome C biogenesis protein [Coriobacteriia bacterium]|nr:cytochrome C biogenesis protein [Coriobacteriia bacterium]MCL2537577.1 cytochrome C biogenesis protein [Coriobacteriia bacterium]
MDGIEMLKLEIYIPVTHFAELQEALRIVGAGVVGNYDSVLSYHPVKGTWRPLAGADPYDGTIGELQEGDEYKVEVRCEAENLTQTLAAIREVHPYEEPLINVIPLL